MGVGAVAYVAVQSYLTLIPPRRRRHLSEFGLPPYFKASNTIVRTPHHQAIQSNRKAKNRDLHIRLGIYVIDIDIG